MTTELPSSKTHAPLGAATLLKVTFSDLGLCEPLQRAVRDEGYTHPTPIQAQAIPHLLRGSDLLGCARTGTGKTAAFALPMLQRLSSAVHHTHARSTRSLVLVPTRELASQVAESFKTYGRGLSLSVAVVYGGVPAGPQVRALARGLDIVVATPGRLLDLMGQGHLRLDRLEILVLDEADQMLDLGFIPDVRKILHAAPKRRQTLLFSATMPPTIAALADTILTNPSKVFVTPAATTVEEVEQRVHFVPRDGKPDLLAHVLRDPAVERALVFTRTKRGADKVARRLAADGIPAEAIHGNKSQGQRERTLKGFRAGRTRVLVATDIAARGIDIDGITHVINYELPNVPESYVHRIGRTARAGARGVAISLCDGEERAFLRDIERLIRREVNVAGGSRTEHAANGRPDRAQGSHARVHSERAQGTRKHGASKPGHGHGARRSVGGSSSAHKASHAAHGGLHRSGAKGSRSTTRPAHSSAQAQHSTSKSRAQSHSSGRSRGGSSATFGAGVRD